MKLILKTVLLIVSVVGCCTAPNCSFSELQECLKYQPNLGAFMQTKEELDDFCNLFPQEIECMKDYDNRCGIMNPMTQQGYEVYKKMFNIICEKKFKKKYLYYAPCLNQAMALTGEKCYSNEVPPPNDEERCTKIMENLHCADDVVEKKCGRDALDIFKKIFHLTYKHFVVKPANCL